MKELFDKYFWSVFVFGALGIACIFIGDAAIRNQIITAFITLLAAPTILPKKENVNK